MRLGKRVADLEARSAGVRGYHDVHLLFRQEDENEDDVYDAYGRDKIGPNDMVIMHVGVTPRFDADGNMIPRTDGKATRQSGSGAPSHD